MVYITKIKIINLLTMKLDRQYRKNGNNKITVKT